jgi:hypothetical protein
MSPGCDYRSDRNVRTPEQALKSARLVRLRQDNRDSNPPGIAVTGDLGESSDGLLDPSVQISELRDAPTRLSVRTSAPTSEPPSAHPDKVRRHRPAPAPQPAAVTSQAPPKPTLCPHVAALLAAHSSVKQGLSPFGTMRLYRCSIEGEQRKTVSASTYETFAEGGHTA